MEKTIELTPQELFELEDGYEVTVAGTIRGKSGFLKLSFEAN